MKELMGKKRFSHQTFQKKLLSMELIFLMEVKLQMSSLNNGLAD